MTELTILVRSLLYDNIRNNDAKRAITGLTGWKSAGVGTGSPRKFASLNVTSPSDVEILDATRYTCPRMSVTVFPTSIRRANLCDRLLGIFPPLSRKIVTFSNGSGQVACAVSDTVRRIPQ